MVVRIALIPRQEFDCASARTVRDVGKAVVRWRETAAAMGLSSNEIERMASAFEHEGLNKAVST